MPGLELLNRKEVGGVCVLGLRLLGSAVGEVLELLLVDLSDDGLVCGRQHGVLLGEVLVEVIHISLCLLQCHTHRNTVRKRQKQKKNSHNVDDVIVTPAGNRWNFLKGIFQQKCTK